MSRLRKLFALLLLLALPLKGMAGMLIGACPGLVAAAAMAPQQQPSTAMPCHEQAVGNSAASSGSTSVCPHCASCLAPMAGMPSAPTAAVAGLERPQPAPAAAAHIEHITTVPQPPPRR